MQESISSLPFLFFVCMKFMVKNKKFFCIVYHIEFFFKLKKRFLGKVYISATNNKKMSMWPIQKWSFTMTQIFSFQVIHKFSNFFLLAFINRSKFFPYFLSSFFFFYCPFLTIFGVLPFLPGQLQLLKFFYLLLSSLTFSSYFFFFYCPQYFSAVLSLLPVFIRL